MRKNRALEQVKALLQADAACVHQNGVVGLFERGHGAVAVLVVALPDVGQHGGEVGRLAFFFQFLAAALGAVVYRIIMAQALYLGMESTDMKLVSAAIVAIALSLGLLGEKGSKLQLMQKITKKGAEQK